MGSHDGIQIVPEGRGRPAAHELPRSATTPEKVQVHLSEGDGVDVQWKDGHGSHFTFAWLRDACPCATCNDTREQLGLAPGEKPRNGSPNPFQLYQDPPRPREVKPVGRYALQFTWNDGHGSGIYSWDYLRRVCQCPECTAGLAART